MNKLSISLIILLPVFSGCSNQINDQDFEEAKNNIAVQYEYNVLTDSKYKIFDAKYFDSPNTRITLDSCKYILNINKSDLESRSMGLGKTTIYSIKDSALNAELNNKYKECADIKLNETPITDAQLKGLIKDPLYTKYKDLPKVREIINQVKAKNLFSFGDASKIYILIQNQSIQDHDKEVSASYNETIKQL